MAVKVGRDIAEVISKILHPYVVLSLVVAAIAYHESPSPGVWAKWTTVSLLSAYLFPLIYMRARAAVVVRTTGVQVGLRSFFREQPSEMALLACIFGIPSATILYFLGYPSSMIALLVGVAATALLIALVNRVYRASFHLALFTSIVIPLSVIFGLPLLVVIPFILLLGVSRYYLGAHTPLQLATGFLLGLMVIIAVFHGFGILR
jgi:membrane-associated phospholipid phosphatase